MAFWTQPDPTFMDIELWLPLIVVLVAALGAVVTYSWQRWADRRNDLYVRKREMYELYLTSLMSFVDSVDTENEEVQQANMKVLDGAVFHLVTIGSDSCLRAIGELHKIVDMLQEVKVLPEDVAAEFPKVLARLVAEIRIDTFGNRTGLTEAELVEVLPFAIIEVDLPSAPTKSAGKQP
jgi:hypothetical protein